MTSPPAKMDDLVRLIGWEELMPTVLADDSRNRDWVDGFPKPRPALLTRPEALWTIFGLVLLAAFLSFVGLGS